MTIADNPFPKSEVGNGIKTAFDFAFKIFATTDLIVFKETATDVFALQVLGVDYTVIFDPAAETGTVTYVVAPLNLLRSVITRDSPETQGSKFPLEGPLPAKVTENALDKLTMEVQELHERVDRAPLQAVVPPLPGQISIDAPIDTRGLRWKDTGGGVFKIENTSVDPDSSAAAAAASATAAAASATAAAASETASAASATASAASATSAATSATAAAASASAAAASAASFISLSTLTVARQKALDNPAIPFFVFVTDLGTGQLMFYTTVLAAGDEGFILIGG